MMWYIIAFSIDIVFYPVSENKDGSFQALSQGSDSAPYISF